MKIAYVLGAVTVAAAVLSGCDRGDRDATSPAPAVQGLPEAAERQAQDAGAVLDDASITAKVKTAFIAEPDLSGLAIDVNTAQNVVTLNGSVASEDLRARAEKIARSTEGVKDVRNNLELKQPG
jgi:hyperosmotically inducible protein